MTAVIKWPGAIKPGTAIDGIAPHADMLPALVAAAGNASARQDLLKGRRTGARDYRVRIGGDDQGPALAGRAGWPHKEFPPRQTPGSFNLQRVMKAVTSVRGERADGTEAPEWLDSALRRLSACHGLL